METIRLTPLGNRIARENMSRANAEKATDPDDLVPGRPDAWTVTDDLLVLLNKYNVNARTLKLDDQLSAMMALAGAYYDLPFVYNGLVYMRENGLIEVESATSDDAVLLSRFFAALGNPDRLSMTLAMMHRTCSMTDLCELTGRQPSSIYHHIRQLSDIGIVMTLGHGEGYVVNTGTLSTYLQGLVDLFGEGNDE